MHAKLWFLRRIEAYLAMSLVASFDINVAMLMACFASNPRPKGRLKGSLAEPILRGGGGSSETGLPTWPCKPATCSGRAPAAKSHEGAGSFCWVLEPVAGGSQQMVCIS